MTPRKLARSRANRITSAARASAETYHSVAVERHGRLAEKDPADFGAHLKKYPDGEFVDLARNRLAALRTVSAPAPAPAPPAAPAATEQTEQAMAVPAAPAKPAPSPGVETPPAPPVVEDLDATYVAVKLANVRAEPSSTEARLDQVQPQSDLKVTGSVKGTRWYRVALAGGKVGYVHGSLIQEKSAYEAAQAAQSARVAAQQAVAAARVAERNDRPGAAR